MAGNVDDNGDGDDDMGGGHNNDGNRMGTMTADSFCPPAAPQGGNDAPRRARA